MARLSVNLIQVTGVEIAEATGTDKPEALFIRNADNGTMETRAADALFIFIGAKPVTE